MLGCIFSLHDRSDDASDAQAAVQCDACLNFCLLLTSPTLPAPAKEKLLRVYGISNMLDNFCIQHSPTVHNSVRSTPECQSTSAVCRHSNHRNMLTAVRPEM